MEWIPCSQELPDDEITVMTFAPDSNEPIWPAYLEGGQWYDLLGTPIADAEITHWMDFPEPPSVPTREQKLEQIEQAIKGYHYALDTHQHGGVAQNKAFEAIMMILEMPWRRGEELAARQGKMDKVVSHDSTMKSERPEK